MVLDGWDVDIESLQDRPRLTPHRSTSIYPSPDGARAAIVHSIEEFRMDAYFGRLAVFEDRTSPRLILRLNGYVVHRWAGLASVIWLTSGLIAVQKIAFVAGEQVFFDLFDLVRNVFSYVPLAGADGIWHANGIVHVTRRGGYEHVSPVEDKCYALDDLDWHDLGSKKL